GNIRIAFASDRNLDTLRPRNADGNLEIFWVRIPPYPNPPQFEQVTVTQGGTNSQPSIAVELDTRLTRIAFISDRDLPNQPYLFSVGLEFVDELNRGVVSQALQEQFRRNGRALTPPIRVVVERAGSQWNIIDANTSFYVRSEGGRLNVYNQTNSWQP